jgi:hypothetical protein
LLLGFLGAVLNPMLHLSVQTGLAEGKVRTPGTLQILQT